MCTPVGHMLLGWTVRKQWMNTKSSSLVFMMVLVFMLSNLPDIDFLFGFGNGNPNQFHHMWTHSIGFSLLCGLVSMSIMRIFKKDNGIKISVMVFAIVSSHLILDLFTLDKSGPYGMQLFWPVTDQYYASPVSIFRDVQKSLNSGTFLSSLICLHNLYTILFEIVILLPLYFVNHFSALSG